MAVIIREQEVDVEIEEELEPYIEEFPKARVRGNKLQSCSPFRHEKTPSFAVNLENGTWIDSGADDESWYKGNFIQLLAFLMGVTYEEAELLLWEKYRTIYADVDNLTLNIQLEKEEEQYKIITKEEMAPYLYRHQYLGNRGIKENVQRAFKVGYWRDKKAVVLPWTDKEGNIINLKFRSVKDKRFWYLPDGQPIKHHIYGLHFFFKKDFKTAFAVESETDAMYLWSCGYPAIAFGSASMSKQQEKLLINSPIERLVIATDKDSAGNRFKGNLIERLQGVLEVWDMPIPHGCKDVNDIKAEDMHWATGQAERVTVSFL